jgi:hypothetical protein
VRRAVPWLLLVLLGIGTALGAAIGASGSPGVTGSSPLRGTAAQQWVAGVLAETKAAGTAHLEAAVITRSPRPELRGAGIGSGVIDFATGNFRVSETDHDISLSSVNGGPMHPQPETTTTQQIAIGRSVYENDLLPGLLGDWTKQSFPRLVGVLGFGAADAFGAVLSPLGKPFTVVAVTERGTDVVSGAPATQYLVTVEAEPRTGPDCPVSKGAQRPPVTGHVDVWVDDQGRLVQARLITTFGKKAMAAIAKDNPSFDPTFGPFTITSTLRLSQLGAPVRIARPTLGRGPFGFSSVSSHIASGSGHSTAVFCG